MPKGQPIRDAVIAVIFTYRGRATSLQLTTDQEGAATFRMPDPRPEIIQFHARLDQNLWSCWCRIMTEPETILRTGAADPSSLVTRAEPGEVILGATRISLLQRLIQHVFGPLLSE